MSKPEDGLYVGRVTGDGMKMMHVDEDTVCDHQTQKLFEGRTKAQEDAENQKREDSAALERAAKLANKHARKQKRCRNRMIKDVIGLIAAAGMAVATHFWGMYVLIAVVTGCTVAAVCRVVAYASTRYGE